MGLHHAQAASGLMGEGLSCGLEWVPFSIGLVPEDALRRPGRGAPVGRAGRQVPTLPVSTAAGPSYWLSSLALPCPPASPGRPSPPTSVLGTTSQGSRALAAKPGPAPAFSDTAPMVSKGKGGRPGRGI